LSKEEELVAAKEAEAKEAEAKEAEEQARHNHKHRFLMLRYTHLHQGKLLHHKFRICSTRSSLFRHMSNQNRLGLNVKTDRIVFLLHHRTSMEEVVADLGPLVLLHLKQLTLHSDQ
jgi:hypothetical protein